MMIVLSVFNQPLLKELFMPITRQLLRDIRVDIDADILPASEPNWASSLVLVKGNAPKRVR